MPPEPTVTTSVPAVSSLLDLIPPKTTLLIGPPGSGKTTMAALTSPRTPVHFIDVDRKLLTQQNIQQAIKKGSVTCWEVSKPLIEDSLRRRAEQITKNEAPDMSPLGWLELAELCEKLEKDPISKDAGTWVIDSATEVGAHLVRLILFLNSQHKIDKSTFDPRMWGQHLQLWQETVSSLIDGARKFKKDLIITVHERVSEVPGANSKVIKSKGEGGVTNREYTGTMDVRVIPSIQGQFGLDMAKYFQEVYALDVEVDKEVPTWVCRVQPDGRRPLRTSFNVDRAEFPPDFGYIWGLKKMSKIEEVKK